MGMIFLVRKERYPLNKGDFYINNGDCLSCGAPHGEAADLIEHGKKDNHCYFRKQPETEEELDRAISAMMVSCLDALRYGGSDERILRRLYEDGLAKLCDRTPQYEYRTIIRDHVSFDFAGSLADLADFLVSGFQDIEPQMKVEEYATDLVSYFRFIQRWVRGPSGVIYDVCRQENGSCLLTIRLEEEIVPANLIETAAMLHDLLRTDYRITAIRWWEKDHPADEFYDKPY